MDQRIADYIRDHRGTYTREALTQQLLDAGYTREAIDATWAALDTPDPDDTAGEGFWGRFFLVLIGINVAVLVLVGLGTGSFSSPERLGLLAILGVALGDRRADRMGRSSRSSVRLGWVGPRRWSSASASRSSSRCSSVAAATRC